MGANTSPNTTTIGDTVSSLAKDADNFDYRAVDVNVDGGTTNDLGTNGVDYYLSFAVPFVEIANFLDNKNIIGTTTDTPLRYVVGTFTNSSSFNQESA